MDNAMVKRGIGAVVLAIIAALLLGYLLKDKSRERQEVVEMNLPGTESEKIPSLSDTTENTDSTIVEGANNAKDTAQTAGATVIAAAAGAGAAVTTGANNAVDTAATTAKQAAGTATGKAMKPGFSIRPAETNEKRNIVDSDASAGSSTTASTNATSPAAKTNKQSATKNNTVVASSAGASKEAYKPRLIKERKTRIVSSSQGSNRSSQTTKVVKPVKRATTPAKSRSKPVPVKRTVRKGNYAIQLMATSSESRAKKLAKTMKSEGYKSFITRTIRNNKVLFRVRVQAGGSRSSALAAQKKMKRRYLKNFFVQNSLVVSN